MNLEQAKEAFYRHLEELYRLRCIDALLGWDQQVFLPAKAGQGRAEQQETLGKFIHQQFTSKYFVDLVNRLSDSFNSLSADDQVNLRETKRGLERALKLPGEFVAEKARIASLAFNEWAKARPANDFKAVQPLLEKIVELSKQEADLIGYQEHPYDALLDAYEPYSKVSQIKPLLLSLAKSLREILPRIEKQYSDVPELKGDFDEERQHALGLKLAGALGYSFETGRLDRTHHPFMTSLGAEDVRITTRYRRENYLSGLYATLHEAGHALYELGLEPKHKGTPLGSAVSLGVHESQSRLWENLVGRSLPFCHYLHGLLGEFFPEQAKRTTPQQLWRSVNRVKRGLIRIEADEVGYSLHIVIRMVLEEALISGELAVSDLPGAWNEQYRKVLEIDPPDYKDGVMQDVHWYGGMIGYFPTYALGNIYGAMMLEAIRRDLPQLDDDLRQGRFSGLLGWLREHVHKHGMRFTAGELVRSCSGSEISPEPFLKYLRKKFLEGVSV